LTLTGCTASGNYTSQYVGYGLGVHGLNGGGISNYGTMTLSGSTVTGNSASAWGGAINNDSQGNLTIVSSFVQNNKAGTGAGISNFGTMTLSSDTLTGNSASSWGGGIYNDGTMTLSGSTVTANSASTGGGLFNDKQGNLTILSSVVQTNSAQDGADICSLGSLKISKDSKVGKISHK
jgi:hypothetical protein